MLLLSQLNICALLLRAGIDSSLPLTKSVFWKYEAGLTVAFFCWYIFT